MLALTSNSTVPADHDIISLIDVRKPFFQQISEDTFKSFQGVVTETGDNGAF
jgi:hypothetical protein